MLVTKRLRLRQWLLEDKEPFALLNADAKVMEFFPEILSRTESDAMADRISSLIAARGWGFWAVELAETGKFLGFVGLHTPALELPFCPCVEVGWRLIYESWGKGYAPEAALEALRFGFEMLELEEIVAFTAVQNVRSQKVMQKIGMRKDEYEFDHPNVPVGNPLRRHHLYKLSRTDWRKHVV